MGGLRRHLEVIQRWTSNSTNQADVTNYHWRQLEIDVKTRLQEKEDLFWELNVPGIEERVLLRILEGVNYQLQAEELTRAFSDFLVNSELFQQIKALARLPCHSLP